MGVEGLSSNTVGIDRIAGPLSPNYEYSTLQRTIIAPFHVVTIMIIPFEFQGVAMHPNEEAMLEADDTWLGNLVGKEGLLLLVNLMFWLMWVNVLLGFTNLIPMVPFDGGHMFKDMVHAGLSRIRALGRKLKLWNFHPLWVDQISRKASNLSSLGLLFILLVHPVHTVLLISESQYVGVEAHRGLMGEHVQLHSSLHVAGFVFGCIRGSESLGSVDKRC